MSMFKYEDTVPDTKILNIPGPMLKEMAPYISRCLHEANKGKSPRCVVYTIINKKRVYGVYPYTGLALDRTKARLAFFAGSRPNMEILELLPVEDRLDNT